MNYYRVLLTIFILSFNHSENKNSLLKTNTYKIFTLNNSDYLFTDQGYLMNSFTDLKLWKFRNTEIEFGILSTGNSIIIFGKGNQFTKYLEAEDVPSKTLQIESFLAEKKLRDLEILECTTKEGCNLSMSISYLNHTYNGFISCDREKEFHTLKGPFPRLTQVLNSNIQLKAEGTIGDEAYESYLQDRKKKKEGQGCLISMAFMIALLVILLY